MLVFKFSPKLQINPKKTKLFKRKNIYFYNTKSSSLIKIFMILILEYTQLL